MAKKINALIIVESPAKAKKIASYVPGDTLVMASVGHIRDLPKYVLGVNVAKDYAPNYEIPKDKKKIVEDLRKAAAKVPTVYLASDPDREGESIAWHLYEVLKDLPGDRTFYRIRYNEITKKAVLAALEKPSMIDQDLVDAQQARRIEDRLSGFRLSKLIANAVQGAKSAGRVQSVALRLIVDRERSICDFRPTPYHVVSAVLSKGTTFEAQLASVDGKTPKFTVADKEIYGVPELKDAEAYLDDLRGRDATVVAVERKILGKRPQPPFITSTLQQAAATHLGYSPDQTMQLAQRLYEEGLISYMRTDGMTVSNEVRASVMEEITRLFGANYLPQTPNFYKTKVKNAQEAHEPIRPTDVCRSELDSGTDPRLVKLYDLIWRRFVASQMAPAQIERTTIFFAPERADELAHDYRFSASSSKTIFKGYLAVWPNLRADVEEGDVKMLPNLDKGDAIRCLEWRCVSKETQPPARYNEASLVKDLEEKGIGRPSTYAATIRTLQDREYVKSGKGHVLTPTEIGMSATDYLLGEVPDFVNVEFTGKMEDELDKIAGGELVWTLAVDDFYTKLTEWLTAPSERVKAILDVLGRNQTWKEPTIGKNGKVIWSDRAFYEEMKETYNEGKSITKPQLATLIRIMVGYRDVLSIEDPDVGPVPPGLDDGEVQTLFAKCAARALNEWETKFVNSLKLQYDKKKTLSEKQLGILRKIAGGEAEAQRPDNEDLSHELLGALDQVQVWNAPVKRGKRVYDDQDFVSSLKQQLEEKHFLTERQFESLKKLVRGYREQIANYTAVAEKFGIKEGAVRRPSATSKKAATRKRTATKR
ncbi:MAG: type I DNA topoisomerase [Kiritimatiellae bacterium]|nr:type I DNA topoisomerase [Kiritimatiellia bacterium]